jgi:hypothetical protein
MINSEFRRLFLFILPSPFSLRVHLNFGEIPYHFSKVMAEMVNFPHPQPLSQKGSPDGKVGTAKPENMIASN